MRQGQFAAAAILLCALLAWTSAHAGQGQPVEVPGTAARGFVGAAACAACHREIHDTWKGARHSKMLQPATAATVKGNFAQGSVTLHGAAWPARNADRYAIPAGARCYVTKVVGVTLSVSVEPLTGPGQPSSRGN